METLSLDHRTALAARVEVDQHELPGTRLSIVVTLGESHKPGKLWLPYSAQLAGHWHHARDSFPHGGHKASSITILSYHH